MKNQPRNALEVLMFLFGFCLAVVGCGIVLFGMAAISGAFSVTVTGAHSDFEPWFLALFGIIEAIFGGFVIRLSIFLFKDKGKP